MRALTIILGILFFLSPTLRAAHIIGGEITYECLGNDSYQFTMRIYRDCDSGGALFDAPGNSVGAATITIFRGSSEFDRLSLGAPDIREIPPDFENPCLILPPNVCVEEGVYVFNAILPQSADNYTISYQRCCRNESITNLIDPGASGATYTVEVTAESQAQCNNSPVFNNFPPIIICSNQPLNFDHSASDADGDQLVYELCTPFLGGGRDGSGGPGSGDPNSPTGVAPNPDLPPPYDPVVFVQPTYSAIAPLAGDPIVTIDPVTGIITGTPTIIGQFVVGVCVREFRNGVLLSTVQRDFQFNVASCEPFVSADIREDEIINGNEYVVNSCGNNTVEFINQSTQEEFIDVVNWSFDINGSVQTVDTWDATITFPSEGTYEGQLILNPGTTCGDTANIFVNVYPDITADFTYDYDTCVAGAVNFFDQSFTGAGEIIDWSWDFDDGGTSIETNPEFLYDAPGTKQVALTVRDTNDCEETVIEPIYWVPAPAEIIVAPNIFVGCNPQTVFFDNLSSPIDETYDILWDFGDGTTGTEISPEHVYEEPGIYSVTVDIVSPIGCAIGAAFPNWITVREAPEAGFDYTPDNPTNLQPDVSFIDESKRAKFWDWSFDVEGFSTEQNPVYMFPDTGFQEVIQIVTHENGCQDSALILIDVEPIVTYFLPNAFTPNSDSVNDIFIGNGVYEGMTEFEMTIWNRWGEKVFETDDPNEGWNGQKNNVGQMSPNGVYVVLVRYLTPRKVPVNLKGFATLIN